MTKGKYRCAIFDIDGTMIDTEKAVIGSLQKLLKLEKQINYSADELIFALGIPGHDTLERLKFNDVPKAFKMWNKYLLELSGSSSVYPEIESTLISLQEKKVLTGIVTSKTKEELVSQFYPFGLQKYFSLFICADDTPDHKPHPGPLLKFLEIAALAPTEAIYIGDTIYDMQCAHGAGVDFALALWGTRDAGMKTGIKLNNPNELLNLLSN